MKPEYLQKDNEACLFNALHERIQNSDIDEINKNQLKGNIENPNHKHLNLGSQRWNDLNLTNTVSDLNNRMNTTSNLDNLLALIF